MPALSTFAGNLTLNALLANTTFTPPTTVWLALYTASPNASDTGSEVTISVGTNYARQPITFGTPSGGTSLSATDITFPTANSNWGTITYAAIRDAATSGHLLFFGQLSTPLTIHTGDVVKCSAGSISVSMT